MAYVYDSGLAEVDGLAAAAQAAFQWTNALDPTAFPSVARIEDDLVAAGLGLLGGGPAAVGTRDLRRHGELPARRPRRPDPLAGRPPR